ncbi:hypothetical protein NAT51_04385 [Flavobacterium amniphilum]|uniref:hypothetical protein n=1 Tax=Flavobacterium amniphilum TaxID=1834035 RepID=UPI00202A90F1|nr:hypothetical protein [Flavobacterium amniphilum]MCL9804746.1 hypothetical protein [Flavobacterium amniphilum]
MKAKILILTALLSMAFFSCTKDETTTENQQAITTEEAAINAKIDIANDDISDIVAEQEGKTYADNTNGRSIDSPTSALSSCATITRVPAFGTPITPGTTVTKTIDFGDGCTLANGNVLKGKIIISFVYQPNATSHTINYEFVNFYHNQIKFNGNKSFTRTMSAATSNTPSLPVITMTMDMTATFPDGATIRRVGQRVREFVSGYGDDNWANNIYKVTGSWTTTFPNSSVQTATISADNPLIIKMSCAALHKPLLVQGLITFTRNNHTATLNYGNGECDNIAILTIDGVEFTIVIGN